MLRCDLPRRSGISLVETLVVIFIIAVLIGLIIPGVMYVRTAASRNECTDKLRQIALAVHSYYDQEKRFPYSTFIGPYGEGPDSTAWSFQARLLPFLEQRALYEQGGIPTKTLRDSGIADQTIAIFICPMDPTASQGPRLDCGNLKGFPVGPLSYKGVSGANWGDDTQGKLGDQFTTDWRNPGKNGSFDGHSEGDGIFYRVDYRRKLRMEQITDGLGNTFMIGEDICGATRWCSWPYANNAHGTCAIPPNVKRADGKDYGPGNWQNNESFRSAHLGGLHFAYADCSVRFISNSIDLANYRAMATIAGNDRVTLPD